MSTWHEQYMQAPMPTPLHPLLRDAVPCPFCGSRNLKISHMATYVTCQTCNADGPEVRLRSSDQREEGARTAVARWNNRIPVARSAPSV